MRVDLFDFDLPPERIALRPAEPRDCGAAARRPAAMRAQRFEDRADRDLPQSFPRRRCSRRQRHAGHSGAAQGLRARGEATARIEATLHRREGDALWRAFCAPAKKAERRRDHPLRRTSSSDARGTSRRRGCRKRRERRGCPELRLSGAALDRAIERIGQMPLPPYIAGRRAADADGRRLSDHVRQKPGAVAAPTASLHFTPGLVAALEARGVALHA